MRLVRNTALHRIGASAAPEGAGSANRQAGEYPSLEKRKLLIGHRCDRRADAWRSRSGRSEIVTSGITATSNAASG